VKEFSGVTVIVEVLPDAAPGLTVKLPLLDKEKLVLVLVGACQKSPHPARRGMAARKSQAHLSRVIATPIPGLILALFEGLDYDPDSTVPFADSTTRFYFSESAREIPGDDLPGATYFRTACTSRLSSGGHSCRAESLFAPYTIRRIWRRGCSAASSIRGGATWDLGRRWAGVLFRAS
jgi:hypothetical protein